LGITVVNHLQKEACFKGELIDRALSLKLLTAFLDIIYRVFGEKTGQTHYKY